MTRLQQQWLERRSDMVSLLCVSGHIALVFAPLFLAAYSGVAWWWILAWLLVGFGMNGLVNLLHESAHALVFRRKQPSEVLGRFVIGPLVFADFEGYQARHWQHHRCLGVDGETKDAYLIDIRGRKLLRMFLRCLIGVEALAKFSKQSSSGTNVPPPSHGGHWIVRVFVAHAVLGGALVLAAFAGTGTWRSALANAIAAYGLVYIYGLMSLTNFAANLRAIAEHQLHGDTDVQGYAALRNFKCNALTRFLMGAYGFGEHETHHLYPGIPYYNLPAATASLAEEKPSLAPQRGYFATLLRITRSTTDSRSPVR